jgi:hypothetical protein
MEDDLQKKWKTTSKEMMEDKKIYFETTSNKNENLRQPKKSTSKKDLKRRRYVVDSS